MGTYIKSHQSVHQRWVSFTELSETVVQEFETKILKLIDKQSKDKTKQKSKTIKSESRAQLKLLRGTCFLCSNAFIPWPCHQLAVGAPVIPPDHQLIKDRAWHILSLDTGLWGEWRLCSASIYFICPCQPGMNQRPHHTGPWVNSFITHLHWQGGLPPLCPALSFISHHCLPSSPYHPVKCALT